MQGRRRMASDFRTLEKEPGRRTFKEKGGKNAKEGSLRDMSGQSPRLASHSEF